jgi:hypothetical protein
MLAVAASMLEVVDKVAYVVEPPEAIISVAKML